LVLCGESGSGKTYHIRLLSLLTENHSYIDLKSLPRNIQKQCLEEALSQNRTLYIDDLHLAGDDFIQLLIVYTDNKINKLYNENASKMNCSKVILSTVNNSENKYYIALMERLKFNIVHIVNLNEIYENQEEVITKFFKINSVKHDELTKKYLLEKISKWSFKDLKSFIINKSVVNDNVLLLSFDSVIDRVDELLSIDDNEKKHITKILEIMDYNILAAAKVLKISRSTLYRKIEKYNIHMSYIETHQANKYKNSKS
jgi:transcriptional regulator of acetoin/glycerol metabolism